MSFQPSSRFLYSFIFFVSLLQLRVRTGQVVSWRFELFWLPPVEEGFTHGKSHGFKREEAIYWLHVWKSDCEMWDWGKRLFCFICGVGGLKLTNTSRLPHWADPNVENKGEKVYSTIPGHVGFCLSLSAHILTWDTLCLQPETGIVHKNILF